MKFSKAIRAVVAVCWLASPSWAEEPPLPDASGLKIGAYAIDGLLHTNQQGKYDKIIALIQERFDWRWRYTAYPPARAEKLFGARLLDCIVPLDRDFYDGVGGVVQSDFLNLAKVHIFTPQGSQPLRSIDELKPKRVGARLGMIYGDAFDEAELTVNYVRDLESNIKMLERGYVDAIVAYVPDIYMFIKEYELPLSYAEESPLLVHEDAVLCHDSELARAFIDTINRGLKALREEGTLRHLLGDSYVAP